MLFFFNLLLASFHSLLIYLDFHLCLLWTFLKVRWWLFQKHVMCTRLDIYIFHLRIKLILMRRSLMWWLQGSPSIYWMKAYILNRTKYQYSKKNTLFNIWHCWYTLYICNTASVKLIFCKHSQFIPCVTL